MSSGTFEDGGIAGFIGTERRFPPRMSATIGVILAPPLLVKKPSE